MPLLILIVGIVSLILLVTVLKLDTFLAFVLVSLAVGLAEGMQPAALIKAVETGIGSTMGSLVMILGFGAMLGKLVADSGAAQRIASKLISLFGESRIQWAMLVAGFIVGIPMFYSVAFVVVVPLIFTVAASARLPLLYVGLPMITSLSVTHGFLPPHPSPSAISALFHADLGKVLLYGLLIAIPATVVAGPFFARTLKRIPASPLKEFINPKVLTEAELPGMAVSVLTAVLPVLLILLSTVVELTRFKEAAAGKAVIFLGLPPVAMLISVLVAICTLGLARGKRMNEITAVMTKSVTSITSVFLIIAGAGILKEVLTQSGVSTYIAGLLSHSTLSPLLLGWLIAAVLRICVGSATVSALTAGGIMLPLVSSGAANAELMVLSIGAGSLVLSQVNDVGFWLYKEYFNLSIRDTLRSWTVMETLVGVTGLMGVLLLDALL